MLNNGKHFVSQSFGHRQSAVGSWFNYRMENSESFSGYFDLIKSDLNLHILLLVLLP